MADQKITPVYLIHKGQRRIIRDVRENDEYEFVAWYKGHCIIINEYGNSGENWNVEVTAPDGTYVLSTYYHKNSTTRTKMLLEALDNILHQPAHSVQNTEL